MVNKTIKVAVATLAIVASGSVLAAGNSVQTCGNAAGKDLSVQGVSCTSSASASGVGKAKRGDKVTFPANIMNEFNNAEQLKAKGTFEVPEVGTYAFYKLGTTKILIGSFDLNADNSNAPVALQTIIRTAKNEHRNANSMIWFGRALANETAFTEVAETFSDAANPAASISYVKTGANSVKVTAPNQAEPIVVDMKPIR